MIPNPETPTGPWLRRGALIRALPNIRRPSRYSRFVLVCSMLALAACADFSTLPGPPADQQTGPSEPVFALGPVGFDDLPGWKADAHSEALPAFLKSCGKIEKLPKTRRMGTLREMGRVEDWLALCQSARMIRPGNTAEAQYFFESRFQAYSVDSKWARPGLFTGYYEAELNGAFHSDDRYRYPILSRPKDIVSADLDLFDDKWGGGKIAGRVEKGKFIPYYTRGEIDGGALRGRQLEILWTDSPVDAFFLHIQGSGRVNLPDGTSIRLAYAGRNGHRYTAVGRELVAAGIMNLDDVSMPAIRDWMEANPVGANALRQKNKSYIFFRVSKSPGPVGAEGVALSPGRSLAVDPKYIPYGIPLWLVTTDPGSKPKKPLRRLVLAQDTGSAIKGPVRGDLFWGFGRYASTKAGIMKEAGTYFLLLPKVLKTATP